MRARRLSRAYYLKAEIVLAWRVMTRHRATRGAGAAVLIAAMGARHAALDLWAVWMAATGCLGAVAWSRLLARSGAAQSVWYAAAPAPIAYGGRVVAGLAFLGTTAMALGFAVWPVDEKAWFASAAALVALHATGPAVVGLTLTPIVGATSAASLGAAVALWGSGSGPAVSAVAAAGAGGLLAVRARAGAREAAWR